MMTNIILPVNYREFLLGFRDDFHSCLDDSPESDHFLRYPFADVSHFIFPQQKGEGVKQRAICTFLPFEVDGNPTGSIYVDAFASDGRYFSVEMGFHIENHAVVFDGIKKTIGEPPRADLEQEVHSYATPCLYSMLYINRENKNMVLDAEKMSKPEKRALRRAKRAFEGMDTYRLLTVEEADKKRKSLYHESGIKQRYHMRRGHWRNLSTGKRVWVRSCYAGDKTLGTVYKDYSLTKNGGLNA